MEPGSFSQRPSPSLLLVFVTFHLPRFAYRLHYTFFVTATHHQLCSYAISSSTRRRHLSIVESSMAAVSGGKAEATIASLLSLQSTYSFTSARQYLVTSFMQSSVSGREDW
ncbi:hypothetical protein EDD37DRAFT_392359 [Exophiala viscosa]|uniref:uncharacterized protein n=1 Tax=Exophiala viscosa TaxID=2486360 RepID=UPI00218E6FAA|nr:hypothetical protein EDD37DRAFT_392359 [Exophiala viscosa]